MLIIKKTSMSIFINNEINRYILPAFFLSSIYNFKNYHVVLNLQYFISRLTIIIFTPKCKNKKDNTVEMDTNQLYCAQFNNSFGK